VGGSRQEEDRPDRKNGEPDGPRERGHAQEHAAQEEEEDPPPTQRQKEASQRGRHQEGEEGVGKDRHRPQNNIGHERVDQGRAVSDARGDQTSHEVEKPTDPGPHDQLKEHDEGQVLPGYSEDRSEEDGIPRRAFQVGVRRKRPGDSMAVQPQRGYLKVGEGVSPERLLRLLLNHPKRRKTSQEDEAQKCPEDQGPPRDPRAGKKTRCGAHVVSLQT